jgi:hypothetical protein
MIYYENFMRIFTPSFIKTSQNNIRKACTVTGGWIGSAMGPAIATKVIPPAARLALRTLYATPQGIAGKYVESLLGGLILSKALPYAPAAGGVIGSTIAIGTCYLVENAVKSATLHYRKNQNERGMQDLEQNYTFEEIHDAVLISKK